MTHCSLIIACCAYILSLHLQQILIAARCDRYPHPYAVLPLNTTGIKRARKFRFF